MEIYANRTRMIFLGLFLLGCCFLYAETIIEDGTIIDTDTSWRVAHSPFIVNGEVSVAPNATLTIEPGVTVKFQTGIEPNYQSPDFDLGFMRINGRMVAQGTEAAQITFTRNGEDGNWGVLSFRVTDTLSIIEHCCVEYANRVENLLGDYDMEGAISFFRCGAPVTHCDISRNGWVGLDCYEANLRILDNTISRNHIAGIESHYSHTDIKNNTISRNPFGIDSNASWGNIESNQFEENTLSIACSSDLVNIQNNEIVNNHIGVSCQDGASPFLKNNFISGNSYGILVHGGNPMIINATISNNIFGLICEYAGPRLINTVVRGNETGIRGEYGGMMLFNSTVIENDMGIVFVIFFPFIQNTIIWNNGLGLVIDGSSQDFYLAHSLIQADSLPWQATGENNLYNQDPLFASDGFQLLEGSPCIDVGNPELMEGIVLPDYDYMGNPRIFNGQVDMGACEWPGYNATPPSSQVPSPNSDLLLQNYPNPFNPETTIQFVLPQDGKVELTVYNIKGQKVKTLVNEELATGHHSILWNGQNDRGEEVASGIYFYQLMTTQQSVIKNCVLIK